MSVCHRLVGSSRRSRAEPTNAAPRPGPPLGRSRRRAHSAIGRGRARGAVRPLRPAPPTGSRCECCATRRSPRTPCRRRSSRSGAAPSRFIPEKAKASTWIMTLVHRRAVDLVRREERRRADPLPEVEPGSGGPSAADSAWLRLERERVQAALAQLPDAAAGGDRARLLRRLHAVRARGAAGRAARHHKEQDVRRPRAAARAARHTHGRRSMDTDSIHDLSAAYALDALDDDERRAFEEHLAGCERCREEVAALLGRSRGARLRGRPGRAAADAPRPDPRRRAGGAPERRAAPAALGLPGRGGRRRGRVRGDRARDLERLAPRTGSRTPRRCRASP